MRILSTGLTVTALIALGACSSSSMNHPTDTGSMALPTNTTTGTVATTPVGRDVGSMSAPSGSGGVVTRSTGNVSAPDVGNMALPAAAQGNSVPRRP